MAAFLFIMTGLGFAALAGGIGVIMVALVEIVIAWMNPVRKHLIQSRSLRENFRAMLH